MNNMFSLHPEGISTARLRAARRPSINVRRADDSGRVA
jgi:hypothetical protein